MIVCFVLFSCWYLVSAETGVVGVLVIISFLSVLFILYIYMAVLVFEFVVRAPDVVGVVSRQRTNVFQKQTGWCRRSSLFSVYSSTSRPRDPTAFAPHEHWRSAAEYSSERKYTNATPYLCVPPYSKLATLPKRNRAWRNCGEFKEGHKQPRFCVVVVGCLCERRPDVLLPGTTKLYTAPTYYMLCCTTECPLYT